jgi:hypothetical protein
MIFGEKTMDHSMQVEASLHPEVNLTIYNANRSAKKQILDLEDLLLISGYCFSF